MAAPKCKLRHLESALGHARDGKRTGEQLGLEPSGCLPQQLLGSLEGLEQRALLELLRSHAAAGNRAKAAALREEYRSMLQPRFS